jgi:glycosyltransferase involved in cell wall biosynthesis
MEQTMLDKKKVVHFSSAHPCFDVRIFIKECRTLAQAGYDVALIVCHNKDEVVDGIKIKSVLKPKNRQERMLKTVLDIYSAALEEDADLYHFHDPELIPVGIMLSLKGKKVIYDVHEDLPRQIMTKPWINPLLRRFVSICSETVENVGVHFFDGVVAVTPTIAERFPEHKTVVVHNYPILGELKAVEAVPYCKRPPAVVYVGGITMIRGIKEMIKAVGLIPEDIAVNLVLAGSITEQDVQKAVSSADRRVNFIGWQSREQVAKLLGRARVGLVLFHPAPNHVNAMPNKLFEYMSAGLPVIASDFPLWRKIIDDIGCGLLVDPLDPKKIADAVQWILEHPAESEDMGKRGQEAVYERYNWDQEAEKLLSFYDEILKG